MFQTKVQHCNIILNTYNSFDNFLLIFLLFWRFPSFHPQEWGVDRVYGRERAHMHVCHELREIVLVAPYQEIMQFALWSGTRARGLRWAQRQHQCWVAPTGTSVYKSFRSNDCFLFCDIWPIRGPRDVSGCYYIYGILLVDLVDSYSI